MRLAPCEILPTNPGVNFQHKPTKVLITGGSGCGKTTYFLQRVGDWKAQKFIFDHEGEFAHRTKTRACMRVKDFSGPVIAFDPAWTFPGKTQQAFAFFCDFAFQYSTRKRGKKLFACDELQKLIGTSKDEIPPELCTILETGRRYELDFVAIAQSPNLIHTRVRNQLTEVVCFRQIDERAMRFVESLGIVNPHTLKPGEFVRLELNTGKQTKGKVF